MVSKRLSLSNLVFDRATNCFHMMNLIMICIYLVGDGRLGYPSRGPYNAIHVGAAAKEMPQAVRKAFAELFSDMSEQNIILSYS